MDHDDEQEAMRRIESHFSKHKEPSAVIANKFLQDEIAKLREQLKSLTCNVCCGDFEKCLKPCVPRARYWQERAEASEAKLKAASEQEPRYFVQYQGQPMEEVDTEFDFFRAEAHGARTEKLYAAPIPPADVQELHRQVELAMELLERRSDRIAELESNLSELAARFNEEICGTTHMGEPAIPATHFETAEWSHLERQVAIAKAREEGRNEAIPEGWQVVPKEPTKEMLCAYLDYDATAIAEYKAMLAAAPKPEVKS